MNDFTLEALIAYVEEQGFRVNNLFHLDSGVWRANLIDPILSKSESREEARQAYDFANGDTPKEALFNALKNALEKRD